MVTLTDLAKQKFLEFVKAEGHEGHGLRILVSDGGSTRPEFALNFVGPDDSDDADLTVDVGDFKVYIDPESAKWLKDASVDYVDALDDSGFKVDAPHSGPGPLAHAVNQVLDDTINPAVQSHGGVVSLVAVEDGTAYLRFGGGCQGCGMVNVTLKQGVEKVLFEKVPEIKKVMDVTDHASGTNPYYQPAK